jgi:hypothetical protein
MVEGRSVKKHPNQLQGQLSSAPLRLILEELGGAFVNTNNLRLVGNISDISRPGLYPDHQERVTVSVDGAEPLYAELRLPNSAGWVVGQRVLVFIMPASSEHGRVMEGQSILKR